MGRRGQVILGLLAVQLALLFSRGEAQYGPPFGEGGWGGYMPPPMPPRGGGGFPSVNCSDLVCGLGSCNSTSSSSQNGSSYSYSYSYNYTGSLCTCKKGWFSSGTEDFSQFSYLTPYPYHPCVHPNCTLTPKCEFNVTRPQPPDPRNASAWNDPCAWADCLGGTCVAVSAFKYRCECYSGFKNLFNNTAFPCMSDCMLSEQCKSMGVSFSANETVETGGGNGGTGGGNGGSGSSGIGGQGGGGGNKGVAVVPGKLMGWALLLVGLAVV